MGSYRNEMDRRDRLAREKGRHLAKERAARKLTEATTPVSQEPVAVPFPGSVMCGCDGATCPDGCKHCNPDLQRKAIEELASQFGASPLPEGEPSEAEVELERALKDVLSSLVAAHSLLSRSPKTAAPSNKMFDQMLRDYKKSIERGRAIYARHRKQE